MNEGTRLNIPYGDINRTTIDGHICKSIARQLNIDKQSQIPLVVTIELVDVFFAVASELAILKEKIERRESGGPGSDLPAPGSATLGADKISQLTVEVRSLRRRVSEVQDEADELRRAKQDLETRIKGIENERDAAVKQSSQVLGWYLGCG